MSKIQRGTGTIKRTGAKNYTQKQAQARLNETIPAFNKQVENSLFVNAVEVDYYAIRSKIGKPCSCQKIEVQESFKTSVHKDKDLNEVNTVIRTGDDTSEGLGITLQDDSLFGDSAAEKIYGETEVDVSGFLDDLPDGLEDYDKQTKEGDVEYTDSITVGSQSDCGICYRTGYQPGYDLYGSQRFILSSLDVSNVGGYLIATAESPNKLKRQGPLSNSTFVEFTFNVPKYFKSCMYSVRDNVNILKAEKVWFKGKPLSLQDLRTFAGSSISVLVKAPVFTHVVFEFDLGLDKIRANIGPESQTLSQTQLEAIGDFPVVLPPSVYEVNNGDILVIRDRRLVLKVMSMERKITADKRQLEWSVQTRVLQPTESIKLINKHIKVV